MSTTEAFTTATTPLGARYRRFVAIVFDMGRIWKGRRDMRRLGGLSDWQLADIGLSRSDLHHAWDVPLTGDPTLRLVELARRRNRIEDAARRVA